MSERETIIEKGISYEGIFKVKELISLTKNFGKDKNYSIAEGDHVESVKKTGRNIYLNIAFKKRINDYIEAIISIDFEFVKVNDKIVNKKRYQVGKVNINVEGLLRTDYEKRWESKPSFWLLRHLFEKYFLDSYLSSVRKETKTAVEHLVKNLKAYLNMLN